MLTLATQNDPEIEVSTLELDKGTTRYSVDTIPELKGIYPNSKLFFVMGADSWRDIRTWKRWEEVLTLTNHIVVSRPGYAIETSHVTDEICKRVVDLRGSKADAAIRERQEDAIYIVDSIFVDTSATEVREDLSDGVLDRTDDLPEEVAKYIEKYELY